MCSLYYKFFLGVVSTTPNELAKKVFFFFFLVFFFFDDDDDSDDDDERATSHRSGQVRGRTERAESGREEGTWCLRCLDVRFRILLCVFEISRERSRIVIVVVYVVFVSSDGLLRVFFCHFLLAFDRRLRRRRAFGVVLVATLY